MALERYAKWAMLATVFWVLFLTVLFGGVIHRTAIVREYPCTVEKFHVDPRFECDTKCPLLSEDRIIDTDDNFELAATLDYDEWINRAAREESADGAYDSGFATRYEAEFEEMLKSYETYELDRDRRPIPPKPGNPDDRQPHCDELKENTLRWYSPKLCMNARWGFEDPLCPPDKAVCYTGHNWHRKCHLSCPLAYNVTLGLSVKHIGRVEKARDIGTDSEKYKSYKDEYVVGKEMTCQVVMDGSNDLKWIDERMSHTAIQWWKWSIFSGTLLLSIMCTVAAVLNYILYREAHRDYDAVAVDDSDDGGAAAVAANRGGVVVPPSTAGRGRGGVSTAV